MSSIDIIKTSITKTKTQAVVNPANKYLDGSAGVCGQIFDSANFEKLTKACHDVGDYCPTGKAVITSGFDLCPYIIHAVGPMYVDGKHNEPSQLYDAYRNSLILAKDNDIHSITFPLISVGIFNYPVEKAWQKALQACGDFIKENDSYDINIIFAVINENNYQIGLNQLNKINTNKTK